MRMSIDVLGDKLVERQLLRMGSNAVNARQPLGEIQEKIRYASERQFATQGRFAGGSWRKLKPATVAYKRRHRLDPRIEHATLRLRRSMTSKRGREAIRVVTRDELQYGTRVPYARAQHKGSPRTNLPARPLVRLTEFHKRDMVKIIQRHVMSGWKT